MRAGQLKSRKTVIKRGRRPCRDRVARQAILWKISRHMIGIVDLLKIRLMAGKTIHGCAGELAVAMAIIADNSLMRAGQLKTRLIVIERRRLPGQRCVAHRAVLGKSRLDVRGLLRALKIILMATDARRRSALELAGVTILALRRRMSQRERKRCDMRIGGRCPRFD